LQTSHQRRHQELQPRSGRAPARAHAHCTNASRSFSSLLQSVVLQSQLGRFLSSPVSLSSTFVFPFITCPLFLFSLPLLSSFLRKFPSPSHPCFFRPFFQFLFSFSPSAYLISVAVIPVPSTFPFPSRLWCKSRRNSDTYRNSDVILFPICPG